MVKTHKHFLLLTLIVISHTNIAFSQNQDSNKFFYEINLNSKEYSGEGLDWILSKNDTTQFFLFGEQHGVKGILDFVGNTYEKLNSKTSFQLALEMDEWTTDKINEEGVHRIASKYPYSIAFDSDNELAMINKVGEKSEIWGMDQMVTAIHPYQRLVELAPNENARRLAQGAFLKATLKMGEYLPESHFEDFETLRKAFGNDISAEVNQILNQLKKSMEIYVTYRLGRKGKISPQVTVEMREQFMKSQFDKYFNKNKEQKVVFKMGGSHTVKGIGPNGVETLGNYVIEVANQNNTNALILGLFNYNTDLEFVESDIFKNSDIVLFDCNEYLKSVPDSILNSFTNSNKLLLNRNDAIVLFNDSEYSNRTIVKSHQKLFRLTLIKQIALGGILIVVCLSLIVPVILFQLSKNISEKNHMHYGKLITRLFLVFIATVIIIVFQIKLILGNESDSTILNGWKSIWIYIILFGFALYFLFKSFRLLNSKTKRKHKAYLMIVSTAFLLLVSFMYYWNIGGMISL